MGSLFIKYYANDAATGPDARPLPSGTVFWTSPSLWIVGGIDKTTALVGATNTINVQVDNMATGVAKTGVKVQIWSVIQKSYPRTR